MSDSLSELEACDLLARLFAARGYRLTRNVVFREYGVTFHIDGWDAAARVGFEFLTSEDDDHDDLTLEAYKTLMAAQQRGELSLFIIDEVETLSAAELTATAHDFLDEVAAAARARSRHARTRRRGTSPGRKVEAGKKSLAKQASRTKGRPTTTKAGAGRPVAKGRGAKSEAAARGKVAKGKAAAAAKDRSVTKAGGGGKTRSASRAKKTTRPRKPSAR